MGFHTVISPHSAGVCERAPASFVRGAIECAAKVRDRDTVFVVASRPNQPDNGGGISWQLIAAEQLEGAMSWRRAFALLLILGTLGGCARIGPGSVAPPPSQGDRNGMH